MGELQAFNDKWGKAFQFATLPFFAFFSWLLFRKRSKRNFLECIVLFMYTSGFMLLANIVSTQVSQFTPGPTASIISFLAFFGVLIYHSWAISTFHGQRGAGNFMRGTMASFLGMMLFSAIIGTITITLFWQDLKPLFVFPVEP